MQEAQIVPIRIALDTDEPFPSEATASDVARALVSFLSALPEPVVGAQVAAEVDVTEAWPAGAAVALLARQLAGVQLALMESMLALIHALLRQRIANRLAVHELGE